MDFGKLNILTVKKRLHIITKKNKSLNRFYNKDCIWTKKYLTIDGKKKLVKKRFLEKNIRQKW